MKPNGAQAAKFCDSLINDFFSFYQGKIDEIKVVDVKPFSEPMPPSVEQMGKMLARCKRIWSLYCRKNGMPGESVRLLESKLKIKWEGMGQIQKRQRRRGVQ